MQSKYSVLGGEVRVLGDADEIVDQIPVATYTVKKTIFGYHLEKIPDMDVPSKIYGVASNRAERIINTYNDRPFNTGVLLKGEKGSGKTMLAKQVSKLAAAQGIPTIVVAAPYAGEDFITFMGSITQPAVVLFDEFDKTYPNEHQESILTLMDGTISGKKLFVLTVNNVGRVNEYMINRPGRVYYAYKYVGLDEDFIREYCAENLNYQDRIEDVVRVASLFKDFNFDMLKALVEEMNRYNEPVRDLLDHLNLTPESARGQKFKVIFHNYDPRTDPDNDQESYEYKEVHTTYLNDGDGINPLADSFNARFDYKYLYKDTDDENEVDEATDTKGNITPKKAVEPVWQNDYSYINFSNKHLVSLKDGIYIYRNDKGVELHIKRDTSDQFDYRNFF